MLQSYRLSPTFDEIPTCARFQRTESSKAIVAYQNARLGMCVPWDLGCLVVMPRVHCPVRVGEFCRLEHGGPSLGKYLNGRTPPPCPPWTTLIADV